MTAAGKHIRIDGRLIRVARLDAEKYEFLDDPAQTVADLRRLRERIDLFTFLPRLSDPPQTFPARVESDNLAVLTISSFQEWWTTRINNKTRNMIRRAEKHGVTVGEVPFDDALVDGIWRLYNETEIRQGKRFAHYGKDRETVRTMSATYLEKSIFIGAFANGVLVGFAKLVVDNHGLQAGLMHILASVAERDKAPANALIAEAVRACASRGISHLVYSHFSYGKKERDSLSDFKEHNGFERMEIPRYFVPLTQTGAVALRLKAHHRVSERVPEGVLRPIRRLRRLWLANATRVRQAS